MSSEASEGTRTGAGLYIIAHCHNDTGWRGPCKIGISKNRVSRLHSLQSGNPQKIAVFGFLDVRDNRVARGVELYLHHRFRKVRLNGEWFMVEPREALEIARFSFSIMLHAITGCSADDAIEAEANLICGVA